MDRYEMLVNLLAQLRSDSNQINGRSPSQQDSSNQLKATLSNSFFSRYSKNKSKGELKK